MKRRIMRPRRNPTYGSTEDFPLAESLSAPLTAIFEFLSPQDRVTVVRNFVLAYGSDYLDVSPKQFHEWLQRATTSGLPGLFRKVTKNRSRLLVDVGEKVSQQYIAAAEKELLSTARRRSGRTAGQMAALRKEYGQRIKMISELFDADRYSGTSLLLLAAEIVGVDLLEYHTPEQDLESRRAVLRLLAPIVDPVWIPAWRYTRLWRDRSKVFAGIVSRRVIIWFCALMVAQSLPTFAQIDEAPVPRYAKTYLSELARWCVDSSDRQPPSPPVEIRDVNWRDPSFQVRSAVMRLAQIVDDAANPSSYFFDGFYELNRARQLGLLDEQEASSLLAVIFPQPSLTEL